MSGEKKGQQLSRQIEYSDEIDLFELLQLLWQQKVLIALFVFLGLGIAAAYVYSVKPVYQSSIVIIPPSVAGFGNLARGVSAQSTSQDKVVLEQAIELTENTIEILKRNLMSTAVQQDFQRVYSSDDGSLNMTVSEDRGRCKQITRPDSKSGCKNIILSASGSARLTPKPFADAYLTHVATLTAVEVNKFLEGMDIGQRFEATDLYRIESAASIPDAPIKPKKSLILTLGIMLGGMLGVFIALIRGMLAKRRQQVA
jgi:LPS O-antigen subunit length determinant protein (WzzB/FepE family)